MCELLHQSLLFESQLTLLFSVTYFRCFSMTDVPAVLKVILCHFSRNDLTLYIYYSLVVPFHSCSLTERRQPPIKSHHFISLCAANHVSVSRLKAARIHFNYDIKARGTTCLPLLAWHIAWRLIPRRISRVNGFSNGADRVSNWCRLACRTWWMLVPVLRGEGWYMAAGITQVNKPKTHGDKRDAGNAADRSELLISSDAVCGGFTAPSVNNILT